MSPSKDPVPYPEGLDPAHIIPQPQPWDHLRPIGRRPHAAPVVQPTVCPACGGEKADAWWPCDQHTADDFHGVIDTPEGEKPA